ncbi:FK506-binding protein 5 [Notolabrus celidotus]|uniref:FK506-binding protein 5 n=1 Tax=Notolabrus celidotus TaxID=1203425 RepID=UPI00148F8180|nr:FK506-binding protein 5 [Notolabrus celidotus]
MEYRFLKGFLVVLLIQHSTAEDLPTSIQSSTSLTLHEGQTLPQEQELPPAEVVPVVAPPSLEEVQQAVQDASEQVEGRGAEEVLKELLERVVEAALGQAEGGGEAKAEESPKQETVEKEALGAVQGETETDMGAEVLEQVVEKEGGEETDPKERENADDEEQGIADVDAFVDVAEEGKEVIDGESADEIAIGVETGGSETEEVEVIDGSPDTKVIQEVVEGTVAALEKTDGYFVDDAGVEDNKEVLLLEGKGAAEAETQVAEEPPAVVEVAADGESEQETVVESDSSLAEQIEDEQAVEVAPEEKAEVDGEEGEVLVPTSDNYEIDTTQTIVGEQEEEVNIVEDTIKTEIKDEQGQLVIEEEAVEEIGAEGGENHRVSITEDNVSEGEGVGDQKEEEEEQIALEDLHGSDKDNQEVLVISAPEPDDGAEVSIENSPENQTPTQSPTLGEVEMAENTLSDQTSNHGNEIITPTDEALPNDPIVAQPTLDHFVKNVLAEVPQVEADEPGEANELVEDAAGPAEMSELGLEAWKIGAISAAVFLVLETVIIIVYILKCRNKNSTLAGQRACEEGYVEPEAATGGDCSDDTLPAGNGNTQQVASLDLSGVASTLAPNTEAQEEEHALAMSNLPPSSTVESGTIGRGPDSSQDLRTSTL